MVTTVYCRIASGIFLFITPSAIASVLYDFAPRGRDYLCVLVLAVCILAMQRPGVVLIMIVSLDATL